jgi:hypothetical protein
MDGVYATCLVSSLISVAIGRSDISSRVFAYYRNGFLHRSCVWKTFLTRSSPVAYLT